VKWKVLISAAQPSNKVILEGPDGMLGSIAVMEMQWDELIIDVLIH